MLRNFKRYDPDGRSHDIWINDQHIVSIQPSGAERSVICATTGASWTVNGSAADNVERLS